MESRQNWDLNSLIDVLNQGNHHIKELEAQLYHQPSSSEAFKLLSRKVQSAFTTAIAMTKLLEQGNTSSSSPPSIDSLPSESSERTFKEQERREWCKKRKTLPRWSGQVLACSGLTKEMPLDDGHSWRKYGQKDILGAKFPRCYYRCTHRHSHGCVATKQVQRSDDDPFVIDITYRGAHTCNHSLQQNPFPSIKEQSLHQNQPPQQQQHQQQQQQQQQQPLLQIFRTGLKVKTEDEHQPGSSPSFSFPSTPANCKKAESNGFSYAFKEDEYYTIDNCVGLDSKTLDSIYASTSTTNSPMAGMDFGVEQLVFDSEFSFDFY